MPKRERASVEPELIPALTILTEAVLTRVCVPDNTESFKSHDRSKGYYAGTYGTLEIVVVSIPPLNTDPDIEIKYFANNEGDNVSTNALIGRFSNGKRMSGGLHWMGDMLPESLVLLTGILASSKPVTEEEYLYIRGKAVPDLHIEW